MAACRDYCSQHHKAVILALSIYTACSQREACSHEGAGGCHEKGEKHHLLVGTEGTSTCVAGGAGGLMLKM